MRSVGFPSLQRAKIAAPAASFTTSISRLRKGACTLNPNNRHISYRCFSLDFLVSLRFSFAVPCLCTSLASFVSIWQCLRGCRLTHRVLICWDQRAGVGWRILQEGLGGGWSGVQWVLSGLAGLIDKGGMGILAELCVSMEVMRGRKCGRNCRGRILSFKLVKSK